MTKEKTKNINKQQKTANGESSAPFLDRAPKSIGADVIGTLPKDTAKKYQMAVFEKGDDAIKVAMLNPQNIDALNVLRFVAEKEGVDIQIYATSKEVFDDLMKGYESAERAVEAVVESFESDKDKDKLLRKKPKEEDIKTIQDAPVSKLVRVIIGHAIDGKASDIHIEPFEGQYRVRFRVDGILHSSLAIPNEVGKAIVSRIKILSSLKIDEKRKPQDGRFKIDGKGEDIDFRISTFPVVGGEKVVMRVLNKENNMFNYKELGLIGRNKEILSRKIKDTHGIILITGPTGSGKSTTLYSFLQVLNKDERNIVTLEDPVEYSIEGVNQSQIKPEIGYDFANGLRSILRQDPNVIMVGEIRDSETAELAIHAALTGHLVFSTLHTNSAIGAIPRLTDMGIEPFLLASSLKAIAAQRLVRRICQACKVEAKVPDRIKERVREFIKDIKKEEFEERELDIEKDGIKFYKGKGCSECGGTGLKGRIAIYECFEIDNYVQDMISNKQELELEDLQKRQGTLTMKQDGIMKALAGMTTLEEVERVTEGTLSVGGDVGDDRG